MLYEWLKIIHVISAAILFGTGMGTAFYMFHVNRQKNLKLIAKATRQVVFADWVFTGSAAIVQAITGLGMVFIKDYAFTTPWILYSIIGYLIAGACWLPVVYLQIECAEMADNAVHQQQSLPQRYFNYFKTWWLLGIPAFVALTAVLFFMANKSPTA